MGGIISSSASVNPILINKDRQARIPAIKNDPYRYVMSKSDVRKAHHRVKRAIFTGVLTFGYLYYHIRYHNELRSLKTMKFTSIQLMHVIPRFALLLILTYPMGLWLFKDWAKLENHDIAIIELKKFDKEYFNNDEYKYAFINKPVYKHEDSNWGRLYRFRYPFTYFQEAGWIRRRREANPHIATEVPPKYDFTPAGPLAKLNFEQYRGTNLPFIGNNPYT